MRITKHILVTVVQLATIVTNSQAVEQTELQMTKKFYYENEPVNLRIIQALTTWLSDGGNQIVAINLRDSQKSNRFFCDKSIKIRPLDKEKQMVSVELKDNEWFAYVYVGQTSSGILVLRTLYSSGGSGMFNSILLLKLEKEPKYTYDEEKQIIKSSGKEIVLKKLTEISLTDRWQGHIKIEGNSIILLKDRDAATGKLATPKKSVIQMKI